MNIMQSPVLRGRLVRLEPLERRHVDGLMAAAEQGDARDDPTLYKWTIVPQGRAETSDYVETALAMQAAGTAVPYATVRQSDGAVIGCTRFFEFAFWDWPQDHPRRGTGQPDVGEIGYTWLSAKAIRSGINTEAKLLMLTRAFEAWGMLRICLQTHGKNERSQAAILRLGARFEGIIRASKLAPDNTPRDSARYSVVAAEWPAVKARLQGYLQKHGAV
ncbi:MAG TPA: GNAT family protein [Gammaproteobacteria bacterium]